VGRWESAVEELLFSKVEFGVVDCGGRWEDAGMGLL